MEIYECGTEVDIRLSNIKGMITCASIRFDSVQYEIKYFYEGEEHTTWLNEKEFKTDATKQKIGFIIPKINGQP